MQFRGFGPPPLGVIYNTTMSRPDSALTLAMLHGFEGKREARIGAVAVNNAGLGAAIFCDAVGRFYNTSGRIPDSNRVLPIGLALDAPLPPDPPLVLAAVERRNDNGDPAYARSIRRITDTAELPALMRNAMTGQSKENSVLVLSAPATHLARSLSLTGTLQLVAERVKELVIVDAGEKQDPIALRKVIADWPTQVVFCAREIGESLPFPGASIDTAFGWSPAHPVVDAYKAYKTMPYDAPSWDMAAVLYAVHPKNFELSEPGTVSVSDDGRIQFNLGGDGKHRALRVPEANKAAIIETFVSVASAKPVVRQSPFRRQDVQQQQQTTAPAKPPEIKPAK